MNRQLAVKVANCTECSASSVEFDAFVLSSS